MENNSTPCWAKDCNMDEGHSGPHGIAVPGGIVFAPHGGGEGGFMGDWEPAETPCENHRRGGACGSKMRRRKFQNGGGVLECPACEQEWTFQSDGSSYCKATTIWSSGMKESDKLYREFVDWQLAEWVFKASARYELGLIDSEEKGRRIAQASAIVTEWKEKHPKPKSFWNRLWRR